MNIITSFIAYNQLYMTNVNDLETFRREWQSELNKDHSERKEERIYHDTDVAVECYKQAVEAEQVGQLNDSLILYRKAFKLDDQVDKQYGNYIKQKQAREAEEIAIDSVTTVETVKNDIQINEDGKHTYNFSKTIQVGWYKWFDKTNAPIRLDQMHQNNQPID